MIQSKRFVAMGAPARRAGEAISAYVRRLQDQGWLHRSGQLSNSPRDFGNGLRAFRGRETRH